MKINKTNTPIALYSNDSADAFALAQKLGIPLVTSFDSSIPFLLVVDRSGLSIVATQHPRQKSFFVDFMSDQLSFRIKNIAHQHEHLVKAVGKATSIVTIQRDTETRLGQSVFGKVERKADEKAECTRVHEHFEEAFRSRLPKNGCPMGRSEQLPSIIDATAGFGKDAFILASAGYSVILLEKNPIVHALLEDGLSRARDHSCLKPIIDRMQLLKTDSLSFLQSLPEAGRPDVIYLDPMFPPKRKSAQVKKAMTWLQSLVGHENHYPDLLATALPSARLRVIVKRPRLAPPLSDRIPTFSIEGKTTRLDVYVVSKIVANQLSPPPVNP